ncbi:uncharacterized protein LOC112637211 [Camponotus floridanus]|uniref:uncharacterized protein LOC112637211 n=1 Tax=Camponotus floridanus TaxID=104421 RepID=UPI000DC6B2BF|nr:uncharacterized protein LOC112637211 [Camponotus floridanus]
MKDQKTFNKVLENTLYPDTEKWKLYSIVRCLYETDDLQKAEQKCKLSEVTSDLQTDNQEVEISKRKITVPRRFISSDEEENDNIYIRPPKLKRKFFNTNKNTGKNIPISDQYSSDVDSPKTPDSVPDADSASSRTEVIEQTTAFLCTIGGRDISTKISRILRYLFTDALASEFSFYGKRLNKRPFSDLCLKTVIVESIKRTSGVTNKEIEDGIKIWLKHAPDRQKNQMKRKKQDDENNNNRIDNFYSDKEKN